MGEWKKRMTMFRYILALLLVLQAKSFLSRDGKIGLKRSSLRLFDGSQSADGSLQLFGSPRTRSPLINWFLLEKKIPFEQKQPFPSNHPFGQVPFLSDKQGEVQVFESGAILLYLADAHGYKCDQKSIPTSSPEERAQYTKWVVWANSELDGLCFGKGMSGTSLDRPSKALDILNTILTNREWLVGNEMTVADIAVASYLNYVPVFFNRVNPSARKGIVRYMKRAAERSAFKDAFGPDHTNLVLTKTQSWL